MLGIFTALDWLRGNLRRAASAIVALAYAASAVLFNWYFIERDESFQFVELPAEFLDVLEQTPEFSGRTVHFTLTYPYYCFHRADLTLRARPGCAGRRGRLWKLPLRADRLPAALDPDDLYVCTTRDPDYNLYLRDDSRFQCVQIGEMLLYLTQTFRLTASLSLNPGRGRVLWPRLARPASHKTGPRRRSKNCPVLLPEAGGKQACKRSLHGRKQPNFAAKSDTLGLYEKQRLSA